MSRAEISTTRFGEMLDLINCLSIYNGATPKRPRITDLERALELR